MTWLDRSEYPFTSRYFLVNGKYLHYIDEGIGPVLLFVHGTPSWSFDFRHVIQKLKTSYRCIAFDHIGFGFSDKPVEYDYTTINHAKTLEAFVRHLKLQNITLIMHDFGGPIGFYFAINNASAIKNFVVLNSWLWSSHGQPDFMKLSKVLRSPLLPFLYLYLNFSVRFLMPASFGKRKLDHATHRHYVKPFAKKSTRYGVLAFARSLLNDQEWFEALWQKKDQVSTKPTLFIWGMHDKFVGPGYLNKFATGFRNCETVLLEDCGHFPQEEEPDVVADSISNFLKRRSVENNGSVPVHENTVIENKL
jgi:pimeloyl-ACP methyl ester carboxylesterase